jgi:hypothetical protein
VISINIMMVNTKQVVFRHLVTEYWYYVIPVSKYQEATIDLDTIPDIPSLYQILGNTFQYGINMRVKIYLPNNKVRFALYRNMEEITNLSDLREDETYLVYFT